MKHFKTNALSCHGCTWVGLGCNYVYIDYHIGLSGATKVMTIRYIIMTKVLVQVLYNTIMLQTCYKSLMACLIVITLGPTNSG